MRRSDRAVTDIKAITDIIDSCRVCRLAMKDDEGLYIVPLNFGYEFEDGRLVMYFHSAKEGRKVSAIESCGDVAFEMDCGHELIEGASACGYGYKYASVTGNGVISVVRDPEQKKRGLSILMLRQTGREFEFDDKAADSVLVLKLAADRYTAKSNI